MKHGLGLAAWLLVAVAPAAAGNITGHYIEARNCDVWTGPCFANGEINLTGKNAVLGWKIDRGSVDGVSIDGLGIVAIISASDTLGQKQTGASRCVLVIDEKATKQQKTALINFVKRQASGLASNVIAIESAPVQIDVSKCREGGCGTLTAGKATIQTRCLDHKHDKACGNEWAFYPPLGKGVKAEAAVATEHSYNGKHLNETWSDNDRRGAYVGSFSSAD